MKVVKEKDFITFEELSKKLGNKEGVVIFYVPAANRWVFLKQHYNQNRWSWHTLFYDGGRDCAKLSTACLSAIIGWLKYVEVHWFETDKEAILWLANRIREGEGKGQ